MGVALANGDEIQAPIVVSGLDPRRTFLDLLDQKLLPTELVESIRRFKFRGSSGKVNLALSELPNFTCLPGVGPHHRGAISISPSLDYIERAYDDAKYGEFSRRPYMDIVFPSMIDPGMAPPGKHVMSVFVQYAPYQLNGGWTPARREAFGDAVIDTISEYAPDLRSVDPASAGADAEGHRRDHRPERREHLPGRTGAAPAVLPPARLTVGGLPDPGRRVLPVRGRDPSGWRHHGGLGPSRGDEDPPGQARS